MKTVGAFLALAILANAAHGRELTDIQEGCGETKTCWGYYVDEARDCDWDAGEVGQDLVSLR